MRYLTLCALVCVALTVNSLSMREPGISDIAQTSHVQTLLGTRPDALQDLQTLLGTWCEEGWTMHFETGICYRVLEGSYTWEEANEGCYDVGGLLVSIHSPAQNYWISSLIRGYSAWIGLNDLEVNGTYVWSDGSPTNYFAWGPNEPGTEQCVELRAFLTLDFDFWYTIPCQERRAAVCRKGCARGWTLDTVTGSCYLRLDEQLSWEDANQRCFEAGSHLASIHSQQENDFLFSMVDSNTWIGLNDLETENSFVWTDGSPVDYINWVAGEPNNNHIGEHCVHFYYLYYPGKWNDERCTYTYNAICKTAGQRPKVDCVVSDWACWSGCSRSCGSGTQSRTRVIKQQPRNGGEPCGELEDYQFCNRQPCPVPCLMSVWTRWTDCSKTCGGGTQTRTRHVEIEPSNGGEPCLPDVYEEQFCNTDKCPGCPPPSQVTVCEKGSSVTVACPEGKTIFITYAIYGRLDDIRQCPNGGTPPDSGCGVLKSTEIVQSMCLGERFCTVEASNDVFGDPCIGTWKYLEVDFLCLP